MTTAAYTLAGLIAVSIIVIGARFLIAPGVAAAGYGVQSDARAYLNAKGIRDIASGLFVVILMAAGETHLLGWIIVAASIIPIADAIIVLSDGGTRGTALGIHGATAAVMLVTSALLLAS